MHDEFVTHAGALIGSHISATIAIVLSAFALASKRVLRTLYAGGAA
jgi:hypothetical protein